MIGKITTLQLICDKCHALITDNVEDYDERNVYHFTKEEMVRSALDNEQAFLVDGDKAYCPDCYHEYCDGKLDGLSSVAHVELKLGITIPDVKGASEDDLKEYLRYRFACGSCRGDNPYFSADGGVCAEKMEILNIKKEKV